MATMVNVNTLLGGKDSRWLQLEVCREYQRNKCTRADTDCKFAHPPANVEVQNGRVTACYDSIKGRCNREKPPCKYFHPSQHLKDQLLINGRNHLALKNALMHQMGIAPCTPTLPGQVATVPSANPYVTAIPTSTYNPYFVPTGHYVPVQSPLSQTVVQQQPPPSQQQQQQQQQQQSAQSAQSVVAHQQQHKFLCTDRPEMPNGKSLGPIYYYNIVFPSIDVQPPQKRPLGDKSNIPIYHHHQPAGPGGIGVGGGGPTTFQQMVQMHQPQFVPVQCEYRY